MPEAEARVYTRIGEALADTPGMSDGDDAMEAEPQGALLECVYCTHVHPGLGERCPRCHGSGPRLHAARMLDGPSSREELLRTLYRVGAARRDAAGGKGVAPSDGPDEYLELLVQLLEEAVIYGFDLREAIAEEIRRVERASGSGGA